MGTPAYTAPERLRGFAATGRSDLYSLGVVLYEAAAGARPFTGDGAVAVAEAVVGGDHAGLAGRRPDLDPAFVAAIERAMATDPDDRFADADEMRAALTAPATVSVGVTVPLRAPATETAVLPPPERSAPASAAPRPHRRRFGPALAAAVVLVLVLAIAVALLVSQGDDTDAPPASTPTTGATVPAPVAGPPLPTPLADAMDRLREATQP
jgi:eukaryotic-like serine/threonine-protein kinase